LNNTLLVDARKTDAIVQKFISGKSGFVEFG
jgi:hypothetical protein